MILLRLKIKRILFTSSFFCEKHKHHLTNPNVTKVFSHGKPDSFQGRQMKTWGWRSELKQMLDKRDASVSCFNADVCGINPIKNYCFRGDPHPGVAQNWIYMSCEFTVKNTGDRSSLSKLSCIKAILCRFFFFFLTMIVSKSIVWFMACRGETDTPAIDTAQPAGLGWFYICIPLARTRLSGPLLGYHLFLSFLPLPTTFFWFLWHRCHQPFCKSCHIC